MGRERRVSERGQPVDYMGKRERAAGRLHIWHSMHHMEGLPCTYHVLSMYLPCTYCVQSVEYMDYMEGLAKNLPRVLYVHGAGQEVIQFE